MKPTRTTEKPLYIPQASDYPPGVFEDYGFDKIDWKKAHAMGIRPLSPDESRKAMQEGAPAFFAWVEKTLGKRATAKIRKPNNTLCAAMGTDSAPVTEAAEHDAWFRREVEAGIAEANAGHLISAAEVEARFAAKRDATRRRLEASK